MIYPEVQIDVDGNVWALTIYHLGPVFCSDEQTAREVTLSAVWQRSGEHGEELPIRVLLHALEMLAARDAIKVTP